MMRLIAPALTLALALTSVSALAAPAPAPPAWTVDKAASKIGFSSTFSGTAFSGQFNSWTADIHFDPKNLAASKAVVSVDVASAKTGDDDRDTSLPEEDWFASKRFPKATFTTTAIKSLGGNKYQAAGTLAIRGVSKPSTLDFTLDIAGDKATMKGTTRVDRSAYGIGQGQFKAADTVPFPVAVSVTVVATRAK